MEVLVVGGTGLIGHYAARALLSRGHRVRVMARHAPAPGALPHGASFVSGDLEKGDLDGALDGVEGLVHAAGSDYRVTPHGSAWEFFRRRNVEAGARLFSRAAQKGVTRGVLVSSFYHAIRPELASHPYIRSRVESEIRALESAGGALALSIIQPPYILGHVPGTRQPRLRAHPLRAIVRAAPRADRRRQLHGRHRARRSDRQRFGERPRREPISRR